MAGPQDAELAPYPSVHAAHGCAVAMHALLQRHQAPQQDEPPNGDHAPTANGHAAAAPHPGSNGNHPPVHPNRHHDDRNNQAGSYGELRSEWGPRAGSAAASAHGADDALPPGWGVATDATGRSYFWHKKTQKVQWDRPTEETPIA
ncbi:hypothetical protein TSOC_008845 [Tetrabaena socialis]|uniref:WW domain-containing protein n=1 Tax=Tetrabaena socialis TaxID=47790 RepID=A0A2J7ZXE5_9CHLO|nr:hypothetical protein TSOC_008845 [Tetrabaena socialis]|eukprot:PNH04943.1 hypothetical protein TSOC_008845 [Tetrabaena socialis]